MADAVSLATGHDAFMHITHRSPLRTALLRVSVVLGYALLMAGVGAASAGAQAASEHRSAPRSIYVTMSDGVRIAVDVWLPRRRASGERIGTLLRATRYWRSPDPRTARGPSVAAAEAKAWNDSGMDGIAAEVFHPRLDRFGPSQFSGFDDTIARHRENDARPRRLGDNAQQCRNIFESGPD